MKILIIPDSFKGSLSSKEVCAAIEKGIKRAVPENKGAKILSLPFADGGEGFAECLADICKGNILYTMSSDIYGKEIKCRIFTLDDTAIIETAEASGLQGKKEVMNASSYGTGKLINRAVSAGYENIILGLGGSGCCDGGAGALAALGCVFKDEKGNEINMPNGADLERICSIDFENSVKDINFTFACDVNNEYCGKNGAAYIFAPQKGATKSEVKLLDSGLKKLCSLLPYDVSKIKGAGAAGGICGGLYGVYSGEIISGFDILSKSCALENKIDDADIIITGEGKTDSQTLMGKLPYKICNMAKARGKRCVVISGQSEDITLGDLTLSLVNEGIAADEAIKNAAFVLENTVAENCGKILKI